MSAASDSQENGSGGLSTSQSGKTQYTTTEVVNTLTRTGLEWSSQQITYSFPTTSPGYGSESGGFSAFSAAQVAAARESMLLWDDLIDVDFVEVGGGSGDIRFSNTTSGPGHAWAYLPYSYTSGGQQIYFQESGDVWINPNSPSNLWLEQGEYGVLTLIHEIGHALGLSHPGDYNGGAPTYANDANYAQDSRQYTVMSYFQASNTGADHSPPGQWTSYGATPLLHDIAAIQAIYGADMTTRTGNTTYGFNSNAGRAAFDFTVNTAPVVAIWDAGGKDTLDLSGTGHDQTISLVAGTFSDVMGMTGNLAIAEGVTIENAVGGSGNDVITGNGVSNLLEGGAGSDELIGEDGQDFLEGGAGADILRGGSGMDWAYYRDSTAGVIVDLSDNAAEQGGDAAGDTLIAVERVRGSAHNDIITGSAGNNYLRGERGDDELRTLGGNDYLLGGLGADLLDGGAGFDWAFYGSSSEAVQVDLSDGLAERGGDAEGDTLIGIEHLRGSDYADRLIGDGAKNKIEGGDGDDEIHGGDGEDTLYGEAGADDIDGGNGKDWANYIDSDAGVIVKLWDGLAEVGGDAAGDTLTSIERLKGSHFADTLEGDDGVNSLYGEGGVDDLLGLGGNDVIDGGAGADNIDGGAGIDWVFYLRSNAAVTVDLSDDAAESGGYAEGDILSSIERVRGSKYADTITGDEKNNYIRGHGGNDHITGGGGDDRLKGEGGDDTFYFDVGFGDDWLMDFNLGNDVLAFSSTLYDLTFGEEQNTYAYTTDGDFYFDFGDLGILEVSGVTSTDIFSDIVLV